MYFLHRLHQRAYFIMAQGLLSMNAWDDALAVLREAVIAFLEHWGSIWSYFCTRRKFLEEYLRDNKGNNAPQRRHSGHFLIEGLENSRLIQ